MKEASDNSPVVPVSDRVQLSEEMLIAAAGDKYPPEQIDAALELLARGEGKFPPGRRRLPPSLVTIVQRERLLQAGLKAVSEIGYTKFTVEDLTERAGVSRAVFYIHFQEKDQCFVMALDATAARLRARVEAAVDNAGRGWRERLRAALKVVLNFATTEVDATRSLVVAGRSAQCAIERHDKLVADFSKCLRSWVSEELGDGPLPLAAAGVVAAIEALLYDRLQSGETEDFLSCLPELMYFAVLVYDGHVAAREELERPANQ